MLAAPVAMSQEPSGNSGSSKGGFATGTEYQLLGTDAVTFGPGVVTETKSALIFKLSGGALDRGEDKGWYGNLAFDRIDFLKPEEARMYDIADGLSYSAGLDIESIEEFDSQSEFVSSRQLGIHYGRLGSEDYNGIDLSVRQLSEETQRSDLLSDKELWSLGVTTGKRFPWTGLDANDPMWTVSLRGQINRHDEQNLEQALESQQWYVSPGFQWRKESFRLSADVLMPFMQGSELEEETDYRVRAKIQKRF